MESLLFVNQCMKKSSELSYDDLCKLIEEFVTSHGHYPLYTDFRSWNNLPGIHRVNNILKENGLTRADFLKQFNGLHLKHNVNKNTSYQKMIDKFINLSKQIGETIPAKLLCNYGLPSYMWYIEHCPDKNITTWNQIVESCGLIPNKRTTKEFVVNKLIELDKKLDRPIMQKDITVKNVGFTYSKIKTIWGGLRKCKQELGLKNTPTRCKSIEYYKSKLDLIIQELIQNDKYKENITWKDILSYGTVGLNYNSINKAFSDSDIALTDYIYDTYGLSFWRSGYNNHPLYTFADGEHVKSSLEYDFSVLLKSLGYIYNRDYERDILYKTIKPSINKKINCDYCLWNTFWIEIAGLISSQNGNWRTYNYLSDRENNYRDKMIQKEKLLKELDVSYLFLFIDDFTSAAYRSKFIMFINNEMHKYKLRKIC